MVDVSVIKQTIMDHERAGRTGIKVVQSKRYLDVDAISVGGRWYPVYTSSNTSVDLEVFCDMPKACTHDIPWLDSNGRAIAEVDYANG